VRLIGEVREVRAMRRHYVANEFHPVNRTRENLRGFGIGPLHTHRYLTVSTPFDRRRQQAVVAQDVRTNQTFVTVRLHNHSISCYGRRRCRLFFDKKQ